MTLKQALLRACAVLRQRGAGHGGSSDDVAAAATIQEYIKQERDKLAPTAPPHRNLWRVVYTCKFDYGTGTNTERLTEYVLTAEQSITTVLCAVRDNAHPQRRDFSILEALWMGEIFSPHNAP